MLTLLVTLRKMFYVAMADYTYGEDMIVDDVVNWLIDQGFTDEVWQCFESKPFNMDVYMYISYFILAQEMDGEAVFGAVGSQVSPDCLKDVLPKYGQRIKVYKTIKAAMEVAVLKQV